jgi:3-dehydroquinate synthase
MAISVEVRHGAGCYPVRIESGLTRRLRELVHDYLPDRRVAVITDRTVARAIPHGLEVPTLVIAPGEGSKTRGRWSALTDRLLALGFGRDAGIIALGGGVVGDLAGFVAATYLRGIPWIQVPTSLLAMVDASVGGKTGVNTPDGKNLVGAFHPPQAVLADPEVLRTLHRDHVAAGLVEAIKHGIVADAAYFEWIEAHREALQSLDPERLAELIAWSVRIKAQVVGEDERESGRRAVLNAGHTIGHAVEQVSGYSLLHGDAVAIGLVTEAALAHRAGIAQHNLAERIRPLLVALDRPVAVDSAWPADALLDAMRHDKKVRAGAIRFALPNTLGVMARDGARWTIALPPDLVRTVLSASEH